MEVIASYNGRLAAERTFQLLRDGGELLTDCVEGVALIENDPDEMMVPTAYSTSTTTPGSMNSNRAVTQDSGSRYIWATALR